MSISKILKTLAVTTVAVMWLAVGASAQVETFNMGANVTGTLSNGTFTISGTGATRDLSDIDGSCYWERERGEPLLNVIIEDGITSIGVYLFEGCTNLTSVTIPNSVTEIKGGAFYGCTGLTSVTIPNSVTYLSGFLGCTGLTSITIPNSVTSIGNSAFKFCKNLTTVTIPNSVISIGAQAFAACAGLTLMTIPDGVTSIGEQAFVSCTGLKSLTIGNGVTSIEQVTFARCDNLTAVTIGNSVTKIETGAFESCSSLTSITIPNSVTSIGDGAFRYCNGLTSVTIGDGVTYLAGFRSCRNLTSITIGNSVTSIGWEAFQDCRSLTSVTIPNSVTEIGRAAFLACSSLTSVTIGNSVDTIINGAFMYCTNLTSVISLREVPPKMGSSVFWNVSPCLYVPANSIDAYRTDWPMSCVKSLDEYVSVLTSDRVVPQPKPPEEATVIAPTIILAGEFTAGPNPIPRQSGSVKFYRQGKRVSNCELRIYDATGNIINKVKIRDNTIGNQSRRKVGTWDLCDKNGRIVSEGTYVIKGVLKTSDGKSEKISLIIGVR